mmetsp:Transcript_9196/g.24234  ORF Transcript_9196/g.24234 Transcript_9196/m.24234 type:complete len:80 (+) Transcript_9196:379-618(+)
MDAARLLRTTPPAEAGMATEASSQAGARKRQKSRKSRDRSELRPRTDQQARRGEKKGLGGKSHGASAESETKVSRRELE